MIDEVAQEFEDDYLGRIWVIEHFERRVIGVNLHTTRVEEHGRWVYSAMGAKEMVIAREHHLSMPNLRQGQRLAMEAAIQKMHAIKLLLPGLTFRARNVTTGDVIMADVL